MLGTVTVLPFSRCTITEEKASGILKSDEPFRNRKVLKKNYCWKKKPEPGGE
jgi:hypothetical protein